MALPDPTNYDSWQAWALAIGQTLDDSGVDGSVRAQSGEAAPGTPSLPTFPTGIRPVWLSQAEAELYLGNPFYDPPLAADLFTIDTSQITDAAITAQKIRDANILTSKLAIGAVTSDRMADLAVSANKLLEEAVTNSKLAPGSVTTTKIADASIVTAKIGLLAVGAAQIQALAVGNAQIADGAIASAKIGDAAVVTAKIGDAQIVTAKIADLAVNNAKIANAAITSAKIANLAVGSAQIAFQISSATWDPLTGDGWLIDRLGNIQGKSLTLYSASGDTMTASQVFARFGGVEGDVTNLYAIYGSTASAESSASAAASSATQANDAAAIATSQANLAAGFKTDASDFAVASNSSATVATQQAAIATSRASEASTSASLAAGSVTSAGDFATAANNSASSASSSAGAAGVSASAANASKIAAEAANVNATSQAGVATTGAATATSRAAEAVTSSNLSANFAGIASSTVAKSFPRVMTKAGFTGTGRTIFVAPEYEDALSPDGKAARVIVGTSSYGLGIFCRELVPYVPGRSIKINATLQYVAGAGDSYVFPWLVYFNAAGVFISEASVVAQQALAGGVNTYTFSGFGVPPAGTAFIRYGVLLNRFIGGGDKPTGDRVDVFALYPEDTTESVLATTQATIATNAAANADVFRASAETASNLSATYRDQSLGHANTAGGHAGAAGTQAGVATTQAANASASAASAAASSLLSATFGVGSSLLINPVFANYPNATGAPPNWSLYGDATLYRTAGLNGQGNSVSWDASPGIVGGLYADGVVNGNTAMNQVALGYYVAECDMLLRNGRLNAMLLYAQGLNSSNGGVEDYPIYLNTDTANQYGVALGQGELNKLYSFKKLVRWTNPATVKLRLYMFHGGEDAGQGKHPTVYKLNLRPATPEEIKSLTVLAPMEATVAANSAAIVTANSAIATTNSTVSTQGATLSTQATAITNLQGRTAAFWEVTAVAGGRAQLRVFADANGGAGVDIVGDTRISGNLLVTGSVTSGQLGANAASNGNFDYIAGAVNITETGWYDAVSVSLAMIGGAAEISFACYIAGTGTTNGTNILYRLLRSGTVIKSGTIATLPGVQTVYGGNVGENPQNVFTPIAGMFPMFALDAAGVSGTVTYTVQLSVPAVNFSSCSFSERQLTVREFRR